MLLSLQPIPCISVVLLQRWVCHKLRLMYFFNFFFMGFFCFQPCLFTGGFFYPFGFVLFWFPSINLIEFCSWACFVYRFQFISVVFIALCLFSFCLFDTFLYFNSFYSSNFSVDGDSNFFLLPLVFVFIIYSFYESTDFFIINFLLLFFFNDQCMLLLCDKNMVLNPDFTNFDNNSQ